MLRSRVCSIATGVTCVLILVAMTGCVRAKPAVERDPLPTIAVQVAVEDPVDEAEDAILPEADGDRADEEITEQVSDGDEPVDGPVSDESTDADEEAAEPEEPLVYDGAVHVVVAGDTLSSIAARYRTTIAALMEVNALKSGDTLAVGQELRLPADVTIPSVEDLEHVAVHVVQYGETLGQIAQRYRMPVGQVTELNPWLTNPNLLRPGSRLTVLDIPIDPDATVHTVARGETLASIAQRYGVSLDALARANHVTEPNRLEVGQVLVIPE